MEWQLFEGVDTLESPVEAANQRHVERAHLYVRVREGGTCGWGEVTPVVKAAHGDPSLDEVRDEIGGVALERVAALSEREGSPPSWSRVHLLAGSRAASRWAHAALEMALLDWSLAREGATLSTEWNVDTTRVATMATVSLLDFDTAWRHAASASRLRVKTAPGAPWARHRDDLAALGLPVLLDFNCSADSFATVHEQVTGLAGTVELVAVEQPFGPGALAEHARLAAELEVAISLDESLRGLGDLRHVARYRAAELVCVKPPRVGGLAVARAMLAESARLGLRAYVGGFFDSPLARRANAAVAAGAEVEPSDVGPVAVRGGGPVGHERDCGIGYVPDESRLVLRRTLGAP